MKELTVRNPYSGEELGKLPFATREQAQRMLENARAAFERWRRSSSFQRSKLLEGVASDIERDRAEFVDLLTKEAGKPVRLANIEVDRAVGVLRWAAAESLRFAGELLRLDTTSSGRPGFGIHERFPRGVIFGITPFNFPLNLVVHKVAPALASGCSILVKPSPVTPLIALKLEKLFEAREPGLFQVILADDELTAELTRAPEIAMISFTGSARVGWQIRKQAPEKPTALELGGNAWMIVMPDAPREAYASIAKRISGAAFGYAGQSCISVQNVAVPSAHWREFRDALSAATESTAYGDPADESVITGPLIRADAAAHVKAQLLQAKAWEKVLSKSQKGTRDSVNLLAPAAVFAPDGDAGMQESIVQEEIFGPVLVARRFDEVEQLIARVNSSRYGLQAGVYTQNLHVVERLYRELKVGGLIVNDVPTTRYDHQPYGGVKDSGQGREGVRYAMEEMTESKFLALSSVIL